MSIYRRLSKIALVATLTTNSLFSNLIDDSFKPSRPAISKPQVIVLSAQIRGNRLVYTPEEVTDKVQSNDYVTVIRRPDGSLQVFYHDPAAGNRLVRKDISPGTTIQISYWDGQGQMRKQGIEAWTDSTEKTPSGLIAQKPSLAGGKEPDRKTQNSEAPSRQTNTNDNYLATLNNPGGQSRWQQSAMPLKVYMMPAQTVPGFQNTFDDSVKLAFDDWTRITDGKITFQFVPTKNAADITINWTANVSELSSKTEAGEARVLQSGGTIDHSDIYLLTGAANNHRLKPNETVHAVALHEIGHSLGLIGHSPNPADIMYWSVNKPNFSTRDINTINTLYARRSDSTTDKNAQALVSCALDDYRQGKYSETIDACELALKHDRKSSDAQELLGNALYDFGQDLLNKKDYSRAEVAAKRCVEVRRSLAPKDNGALRQALHLHAFLLDKLNREVEAARIEQEESALPN